MRLGNFLEVLERETGLRAKEIDILTGYPPAPVRVPHDPDSLLSCLAISNGDTLLIRRQETTSVAASEPTAVTSKLAANSPASEGTQVQGSSHSSRGCWTPYMHSLGIVCTSPSQAGFRQHQGPDAVSLAACSHPLMRRWMRTSSWRGRLLLPWARTMVTSRLLLHQPAACSRLATPIHNM